MKEKPKFTEEDGVIQADFSPPAEEEIIPWKWKFEEMRTGLEEIKKSRPNLDEEAEKYTQEKEMSTWALKDIETMVIFSNLATWQANPQLYVALLAEWDRRMSE